jgi:predicted membrane-bound spermidine synthase
MKRTQQVIKKSAASVPIKETLATKRSFSLLVLAVVEGAAVMALELVAGQLLAPSFGDSLTTWMWILICTMLGLALGYFAGACCAASPLRILHACWAVLVGLVYVATIPLWYGSLLSYLFELPIGAAVPLAAVSIFLVPMAVFGLVPGFLVSASSDSAARTGSARAGTIFACSTCGGILAAFLVGLFLIPTFGVTRVVQLSSVLLGMIPSVVLILEGRYRGVVVSMIALVLSIAVAPKRPATTGDVSILDFQEGLLGQLVVADERGPTKDTYRYLYVNRIAQTRIKPGVEFRLREQFPYVQSLASVMSSAPRRSKVLLLGLGGGSLVRLLHGMGFDLTVVEIDPRMASVAKDFFELPEGVSVELADARRFLRYAQGTFDIIIVDVYRGEFLPPHVLTLEALQDFKAKLTPNGMVVVNIIGTESGEYGSVSQAILKTFDAAGWRCNVIAPRGQMNTLIVADRGGRTYGTRENDSSLVDGFPLAGGLFMDPQLVKSQLDKSSSIPILTDDLPVIEKLNRETVAITRQWYIKSTVMRHLQNEIALFR